MQILVRKVPPAGVGVEHPLLDRIYAARGISDIAQMDRKLSTLLSPAELPDIAKAAQRLADAVQNQEKILIVGDFDADGATSVALCMLAIKSLGAEHIDFLVPNRFDFGYGLSPEIVQLAQSKSPDLIVTVDNVWRVLLELKPPMPQVLMSSLLTTIYLEISCLLRWRWLILTSLIQHFPANLWLALVLLTMC